MHKNIFSEITIDEFDSINETHEFSDRYKRKKEKLIRDFKTKEMRPKRWFGLSPAVATGVVFGLCAVTAFAGVQLYKFSVSEKSAYSVDASLEAEAGPDLTEVDAVEINTAYLPEGLVESDKEGTDSYVSEDGQCGYYMGDILVDTKGGWTENYVLDAETMTIGDRDALFIEERYSADTEWKSYDLFISFPEFNRLVKIWGWGHVDKKEMIKIAEGIELESTGSKVSVADLATWSGYLDMKKEQAAALAQKDDFEFSNPVKVSDTEMANLHLVGERFALLDGGFSESGNSVPVDASVTGVEVADDFSLLNEALIPESWSELLNADGKLSNANRVYIKHGDGINSMPEIVSKKEIPVKLVYVSIEYFNNGTEDIKDFYFYNGMSTLNHEGDSFSIYTAGEDSSLEYDEIDYETQCVGAGEMFYFDIEGFEEDTGTKNYIPEIKVGQSAKVKLAFIMGEDELENMYLNWSPNSIFFGEEDLAQGYVDLNS